MGAADQGASRGWGCRPRARTRRRRRRARRGTATLVGARGVAAGRGRVLGGGDLAVPGITITWPAVSWPRPRSRRLVAMPRVALAGLVAGVGVAAVAAGRPARRSGRPPPGPRAPGSPSLPWGPAPPSAAQLDGIRRAPCRPGTARWARVDGPGLAGRVVERRACRGPSRSRSRMHSLRSAAAERRRGRRGRALATWASTARRSLVEPLVDRWKRTAGSRAAGQHAPAALTIVSMPSSSVMATLPRAVVRTSHDERRGRRSSV